MSQTAEQEDTCWVITYCRKGCLPYYSVVSDISPQKWLLQEWPKNVTVIRDLEYKGDDYLELKVRLFRDEFQDLAPYGKLEALKGWKASPKVKEVLKLQIHVEWVGCLQDELRNQKPFDKFRKLVEMKNIPPEVSLVLRDEIDLEVFEWIMLTAKQPNGFSTIKEHLYPAMRDMLLEKFRPLEEMTSEVQKFLEELESQWGTYA